VINNKKNYNARLGGRGGLADNFKGVFLPLLPANLAVFGHLIEAGILVPVHAELHGDGVSLGNQLVKAVLCQKAGHALVALHE